MEVEVISRETIKPSSPTPSHLRTYKVSLLDQFFPTNYVPMFIYYHPTTNNGMNSNINQRLPQLKDSLPETLTRFYPLAGRVKDHHSIDCNDEGVLFCRARVKCPMAELLRPQPKLDKQFRLLPWLPGLVTGQTDDAQVAIQLNMFDCGGLVIGVLFLHKIIDAATITAFLKSWAAIANGSCGGGGTDVCPDYSAAVLFPQSEAQPDTHVLSMESFLQKEGKGITKRFVFDAAAISTLKARATSELVPVPTRVETLFCFIWKHAMAASRVVSGVRQPSTLSCGVNLRPKMTPPLPECSVGNILWKAVAFCDEVATEEMELHGLVSLLRAALKKTTDEIVPKLQGVGGYDAICKNLEEHRETFSGKNLIPYMFNSWCRIGANEVDFGWGKPAWVSFLAPVVDAVNKNCIVLIESGCDDNKIEAWIVLDLQEMAILENDPGFIAFASLNPSISSDPVASSCST